MGKVMEISGLGQSTFLPDGAPLPICTLMWAPCASTGILTDARTPAAHLYCEGVRTGCQITIKF